MEAHNLFKQWPTRMEQFCSSARITAEHFSQDRLGCPEWFESFIEQHLCVQKRGITIDQVMAARALLVAEKKHITKVSVSQRLGVTNAKAINQLLNRRITATDDELVRFGEQLTSWCEEGQKRRSSTEVRCRDALILMFAILGGRSVAEVSLWSRSKCIVTLTKAKMTFHVSGSVAFRFLESIDGLLVRYEQFQGVNSSECERPFFTGFRDVAVPMRSPQKALSMAMASFDPLLNRSVSVFSILNLPLWEYCQGLAKASKLVGRG
jgi:hypothetical protein